MPTQNLIFIALPNGLHDATTLNLSIFLTPHLTRGATLADFPDMLGWVPSIAQHGLQFELTCGSQTASVAVDRTALRADLWTHLFKSTTYVEPFTVPGFDQRLIVSYPVRAALSYLKYAYQSTGMGLINANSDDNRLGIGGLLEELMFRQGTQSTLAATISATRLAMLATQAAGGTYGAGAATGTRAAAPTLSRPDGVGTTLTKPANTAEAVKAFSVFHHMPPAPGRPDLPSDFSKTLDFHGALTALSSYPTLLRALGLVFDVRVPVSFCPASSVGAAYATIAVSKVTPGVAFSGAPQLSFPATACYQDGKAFAAAPITAPGALATKTYSPGDVVGGLLTLAPQAFNLMGVDLDGAMLQALSLADNVANVAQNFSSSYQSTIDTALPALRSAGIGLIASGRGMQLLAAIQSNRAFNDAASSNTPFPQAFSAVDLVRGYRLDVWDARSGRWHSLHQRNATYAFPGGSVASVTQLEEGFVQTAVAQPADDPTRAPDPNATAANAPQPGTDLYIHERIARWDGWSLSAPRPGLSLNRSADPGQALDADPTVGQPSTPFKMTSSYTAAKASLPELRFGGRYKLRVRVVDLAGNSVALDAGAASPFTLPANDAAFPYYRFEPVAPPIIVLRTVPTLGGSLNQLVIRSLNASVDLDTQVTADTDQRHIAPPRTSVRMAEQLGVLDDANGKLLGSIYPELAARDSFKLPLLNPADPNSTPFVPGPTLDVGYLADPLARGAVFRNLPNTVANTDGVILKNKLEYALLPEVQPSPDCVTYIDFGPNWPQRLAFRLLLQEGVAQPAWDSVNRVLSVSLPKGASTTVPISSFMSPADLELMGVWSWLREWIEAAQLNDMQDDYGAGTLVTYDADSMALITRLVLEGGHAMLTPALTLSLVHAVQQPLGVPAFVQLPVVHQTSAPIFASGLRNSFTPITAWRSVGAHTASLLGGLSIRGQSTARIDLQAQLLEVTDDPSLPAPTTSWTGDHVETLDLSDLSGAQPIYSDALKTRAVAVYVPKVDTLWFAAPFDTLDGVTSPSTVAAPLHRFDDTKHRWVSYTAIATSRYQEYFDPSLTFTRTGDALIVDVPSSARPTAPSVAYVVPTFGWQREETTNLKTNVRLGNGLRVYLERPWYSSGDNELLGVVLWSSASPAPDYATRDKYKTLFTQWGNDPIWQTSLGVSAVPATYDMANAANTAAQLTIEENTAITVDVAGYAVQFDQDRNLWYCDIEFNSYGVYMPFVRLALARYQPHSIQGVELSRIVLTDYAQLASDRSAMVSIDPADTRLARVFVGGAAPTGPRQSQVQVSVQQLDPHVQTDLGWSAAAAAVVTVTPDSPQPLEPNSVLWSGTIQFAKAPAAGQFRVVIREFEQLPVDPPPGLHVRADGPIRVTRPLPIERVWVGSRLVYAAIFPYDYP
jgi:hypothetical protein